MSVTESCLFENKNALHNILALYPSPAPPPFPPPPSLPKKVCKAETLCGTFLFQITLWNMIQSS